MVTVNFCTCLDYACKSHPSNHDKGCTLCVAKNLAEQEIPACFFRKLQPDMEREMDYSFKGFAGFVLDKTSDAQ